MKLVNETYVKCAKCGVEAFGLSDIQTVFGYKIIKEDIIPFEECRECRGAASEEEERRKNLSKKEEWATTGKWGRQISISRRVYDSYLIELGYLEHDDRKDGKRNHLVITKKGSSHSKVKNSLFGKIVLWDENTHFDVIKARLSRAIIHDICPKCKAYLDTMPGFHPLDVIHKCKRCGNECDLWEVKATYDR